MRLQCPPLTGCPVVKSGNRRNCTISRKLRCTTAVRVVAFQATGPDTKWSKYGSLLSKSIPGLAETSWHQDKLVQKYPPLNQDATADVLVVGAGLAGLSIAYELARAGKKVIVVESRVRAGGQSGRSSAQIMRWNDSFYNRLASKFGDANVKLVAQSHDAAIDHIETIVNREKIDCQFSRVDGFLYPADMAQDTMAELDKEWRYCHTCGMSDVEIVNLEGKPEYGGVRQAIKFPRCAEFDPIKYVEGLADAFVKMGGVIHEGTGFVDTLNPELDGRVPMTTGYFVTAREAVVMCTNSPVSRNLAVHSRQEVYRSYMSGFKVPKGSVAKAQLYSTADPYTFIRTKEEEDHDVLLVGGGDHVTGIPTDQIQDVWQLNESYTRQRYPQAGEVVYRWVGQVYDPVDDLGLYGLDPADPLNVITPLKRYVSAGHSGQGTTGSAISAMVISDQILGRPNPYTDIYSPARLLSVLQSPQALGQQLSNTARGFAEVVVPRSVQDLVGLVAPSTVAQSLKPGEGAVAQEGGQKVALYCDAETGTVTRMSATCPHLGCILNWNPNSSTFDCSCHGSEFDARGRCIQAPAANDMAKL